MDLDVAVDLVLDRHPELDLAGAELISPGWDFDVLMTDDWVVRFPRRPDVGAKLALEVALLPALRPRLPVPVPRYELRGVLPDGITQWGGYRRVPGAPAPIELLASDRGGIARSQITGVLEALAAVSVREAVDIGVPHVDVDSWWRAQDTFLDSVRERVLPLIEDVGARARAEAAMRAHGALPREFRPQLLHGDFHRGHLLCDVGSGTLTGVIDWSGAQIGDPALEAAQLLGDLPPALVQDLLPDYDDPHLWDRALSYRRLFPLELTLHGVVVGEARWVELGLQRVTAAAG